MNAGAALGLLLENGFFFETANLPFHLKIYVGFITHGYSNLKCRLTGCGFTTKNLKDFLRKTDFFFANSFCCLPAPVLHTSYPNTHSKLETIFLTYKIIRVEFLIISTPWSSKIIACH